MRVVKVKLSYSRFPIPNNIYLRCHGAHKARQLEWCLAAIIQCQPPTDAERVIVTSSGNIKRHSIPRLGLTGQEKIAYSYKIKQTSEELSNKKEKY
jgi:hypothetical protein